MTTLTPIVFGMKHIVGSSTIILLIITILLLTVNHQYKDKRIVLKVSALFLIILELVKYLYIMKQTGGIPNYMFPLQLCSFSLYAMPMIAFGGEKTRSIVKPFGYAIGLISGVLVLVLPTTVLGSADFWFPYEGDILPYISFLYHGNMIFFSLYMVLSKEYQPVWKDSIKALVILVSAALVAGITNLYLQTDFMFLRTGSGNPLQGILLNYGYIPYLLAMVVLGMILLSLVFVPNLFNKKSKRVVK
jgi:uncharacterized membrane protein YwaF